MEASSFAIHLEKSIPKFKELWAIEDIYREENRSFSPHSLVAFLRDFILFEYPQIKSEELVQIAKSIEQVFIEDPDSHWSDGPTLKDALITNFLSIAPEPAVGGLSIKEYLGPISQSLWDRCP
ncbi:hypothetical protein [Arenicella xantha]|uniref:Uncharacterized protein n=1 Tax=Arenicella xantha TaxID=644221 RepID=A0A395JFD0_9GAMM|nr:hypothetical protein [Arenicella xantha]RBP45612.1 hypothetical protein DFR28_1181 [Arenicella xantha]